MNSGAKFTPEPWRVVLYAPNGLAPTLAISGPENGPVVIGLPGDRDNDAVANLIAAAPDLFEALVNIENDDGSIPKTIWELRNRALAKALGEDRS